MVFKPENKEILTAIKKKKNIGSSFEDFLETEGIKEEVNVAAVKTVIARQLHNTFPTRLYR